MPRLISTLGFFLLSVSLWGCAVQTTTEVNRPTVNLAANQSPGKNEMKLTLEQWFKLEGVEYKKIVLEARDNYKCGTLNCATEQSSTIGYIYLCAAHRPCETSSLRLLP